MSKISLLEFLSRKFRTEIYLTLPRRLGQPSARRINALPDSLAYGMAQLIPHAPVVCPLPIRLSYGIIITCLVPAGSVRGAGPTPFRRSGMSRFAEHCSA